MGASWYNINMQNNLQGVICGEGYRRAFAESRSDS